MLLPPDGRPHARDHSDPVALRTVPRRAPVRVSVVVGVNGPSVVIPRSFLGFSTEYWTLPVDENHVALYRRVIALLHTTGDGGFVLRIGGVSSDHSFWQLAVHRAPEWAFAVTPR